MKTIVITGVTRGCGRAMAEEFMRLGHRVAGCGTSADKIDALNRQFEPESVFDLVNVTQNAEVAKWAQRVIGVMGAPDLLINNAAVINPNAPLWKVSAEDFDRVMDVNLKGVANVIRHFVPEMIAKGSGVIVNISSGWGRSVDADVAPYCTTKWGIEGLSRAMALELPANFAVVAVNPGIIDTEMLQSAFGVENSANFPKPGAWAQRAAPFLLSLGAAQNGKSLNIE